MFLVGGGNTYQLASKLKKYDLLESLKEQVLKGALYVGFSAGANIAGPNVLTTNDWNVLGLTVFEGLGLVPFNINPHYVDPHNKNKFSAESRDDRILEYLVFNDNPVVAIEEKTFLEITDSETRVGGYGKAKVFIKGKKAQEFSAGFNIEL